jgi:hypothetical protein
MVASRAGAGRRGIFREVHPSGVDELSHVVVREGVVHRSAVSTRRQHAGAAEQRQLVADRRFAHAQRGAQVAYAQLARAEGVEDGEPGRVADQLEELPERRERSAGGDRGPRPADGRARAGVGAAHGVAPRGTPNRRPAVR